MLDMRFFQNPRFTAANSAITLTFFAMFGSMFLMTQYWQFVHGYSPLGAGLRMIPYALTMMVVAPMSARVVERVGTKRVVTTGLLIVASALRVAVVHPGDTPYPVGDQRVLPDGRRHGHDDGAGHRVGDGLAAAGEGRRRLGRQRHDPPDRRRARRRRHRQRRVERLRRPHQRHRRPLRGDRRRARPRLGGRSAGRSRSAAASAPSGVAFIAEVKDGFVDALSNGLRLSSVIILGAAFVAWRFLPARARDPLAVDVADEAAADAAHGRRPRRRGLS